MGVGPMRGAAVAVVAALALAGPAACGSPVPTTGAPTTGAPAAGAPGAAAVAAPKLRILLTNDDGWNAPGIVAVREALRRAGHTVIEVAPARDQSGTGAALTLTGTLTLTRPSADPDVWSVTGRPADTTAVGLRSVLAADPPDLVVSGANLGNNVSVSAIHSGTIGAATTAVEFGIPAVAVSGPSAAPGDRSPAQYAAAADFTARLVDQLAAHPPGAPLLPPGIVLNVNYPEVAPGAVARSVRAVPTSDTPLIDLRYRPGPEGALTPEPAIATGSGDDDAGAVAAGDVALTDLLADPQAPGPAPGVAAGLAGVLRP